MAVKKIKKSPATPSSILYNPRVQIFIISIAAVLCYGNSLFNDYALDDDIITENVYIAKGIHGFKDIWTHAYAEHYGYKLDYRPISVSLYAVEFIVFGKNPAISHLLNLLFYILNLAMLYLLCIRVFKLDIIHPLAPLLILLLYAVHPSHTEVVDSFKNRDEMISFILVICAAIYYQKSFEDQPSTARTLLYIFLTFVFLYMSMLTKLVSAPFMACMFIWSVYNKHYKKYFIFTGMIAGFFVATIGHTILFRNFLIYRNTAFYENPLTLYTDISLRFGLVFNTAIYYTKFLLIPFPFRYYYGYNVIPFESVANPVPLASFLLYAGAFALLVYSFVRKKEYSYYLCAYLFFIFFYSNILIPYTGIVSERAMYQSSFFFIACIILVLLNAGNKNAKQLNNPNFKKWMIGYSAIVLIYGGLTTWRNTSWKSSEVLIAHDIKYLENSLGANFLAGNNFYLKGMEERSKDALKSREWFDLSIKHLNRCVQLSTETSFARSYFCLGKAYRYGYGNLAEAEKNYKLFEKNSKDTLIEFSREMASLYFLEQKYNEAIPYYAKAVKEEPKDAELLFYEALNLFNANRTEQFLKLNDKLLREFPETYYPYLNLGTYYLSLNDPGKTVESLEKAIHYGCTSPEVIDHVIEYFRAQKNTDKVAYYEKVKYNSPVR